MKDPHIPLPDQAVDLECICGSGHLYGECCLPRLQCLNRTVGYMDGWRNMVDYKPVFQAYSDLLWEEQYRDDEQGRMAQEYEEWDEWASYLWMEGVLFDGFTLEGIPPIPQANQDQLRKGDLTGEQEILEALFKSHEGIYQLETPFPSNGSGLVGLKLPPLEMVTATVPRVFLPPDTELTDMVIGRFVRLGQIHYPTHRPLVIPMLPDASNFDAAYRVLAPSFPSDTESPAALEMMARLMKARGDLILRAALEALLPLEEADILAASFPMAADGGEIRYMVSDSEAVEYNLDCSPFFEMLDPMTALAHIERIAELLEDDSIPPPPGGPGWRLRLLPDARKRLRGSELQHVESLLRKLAQRVRPPAGIDPFEHWAEDPGMLVFLDENTGILIARAFLSQPLELGRYILEREVGSFLARESEEYLTP